MCPKEYDENLAAEIDRVKKIMLGDPDDPTSYNYKRVNNRPKIDWWKIILCCIMVFSGFAVLDSLLTAFSFSRVTVCWICIAAFFIVLIVFLKRILIVSVQIYQRYAPEELRNKCRFEPSCSEYMILSLKKYGLMKGLYRGIQRLSRCNIHNGGYDFP